MKLVDSMTEIKTNATANQMAGALALKEYTSHTHDDRYFTETEVTNLLKNKSNLLAVETKSGLGSNTTAYGGSSDVSLDISKSGYTPIGIVGYKLGDASIVPYGVELSGTTATLHLKNVESGSGSLTWRGVYITVLYVKN